VLRVREADGTERVLLDPMAVDPAGTTTLDAWSPSWEGDRLAYQLSTGGDEESRLYVLDVATGERSTGRSTAAATPPSPGCPAARSCSTSAAWRPELVPAGEEQFHRGSGATAWAADPPATSWCTARAATRPPTSARAPAATAAGWSSRRRWAPRHATTSGWPTSPGTAPCASCRWAWTRRPRPWVARDGRLWLMSDRGTPRGRLAVADPPTRPPGHRRRGGTSCPQQETACSPTSPSSTARTAACRCSPVHSVDADRPALGVGRRRFRAGRARSAASGRRRVSGVSAPPEGGSTAWVGFTDHSTPPSGCGGIATDPPR
jgi:prolyl oligopeptidase